MSMDKTAFMQSLFALMGKAVRILRTDGSMTEGIVKGILMDGAELITMQGIVKVPYEEVENLSAFSEDSISGKAVVEPKVSYKTKEEAFADLEKTILDGNRDALLGKLSDAAFYKTAGLSKKKQMR